MDFILTLFAVSIRGRKAFTDGTGTLYLECTSCDSIKPSHMIVNDKKGFLGKRHECQDCNKVIQDQYRMKMNIKKAIAKTVK